MRFIEAGTGRFPPEHVRIAREGKAALDAVRETGSGLEAVEAFGRALAAEELFIAEIDVRGDERRALGVGTGDHECRDTADIRGQARGNQIALMSGGWDQHLTAEVAALLLG